MTQTFVTIPLEDWQRLLSTLEKVEERLKPKDEWLGIKEACSLLGVNSTTFRTYRAKFNIPTSQVGRRVMVLRSEIEKLIKQRTL